MDSNTISGPEVIICEDQRLFARDLEARLEAMGFQVRGIAADADDALTLARELRPDLAVMDILIEGDKLGTEVAKILDRELGIPSVFITAYCDDATISQAQEASPLGYLVKPVGNDALRATMGIAVTELERRRQLLQDGFKLGNGAANQAHAKQSANTKIISRSNSAPNPRSFGLL